MTRARQPIDTAPVKARLLQFLAKHRNEHLSVREIAETVGCSRQYLYSVLPDGYAIRRSVRPKLERFLDAHPEAVLPKSRGGLAFKAIAASLHVNPATISRLWREMGLPDRAQFKLSEKERNHRTYERNKERHQVAVLAWRARNAEKVRAMAGAAWRRWRKKVIRDEECIVCGSTFPWTNAREQGRLHRGRRVVCSRRCAALARLR